MRYMQGQPERERYREERARERQLIREQRREETSPQTGGRNCR